MSKRIRLIGPDCRIELVGPSDWVEACAAYYVTSCGYEYE